MHPLRDNSLRNNSLRDDSPSAPLPHPDRCHVFHIGLSAREVLVLESLFRLRPHLQQQYTFAPSTDQQPADLLFVDGDDDQSILAWHEIHDSHPNAQAVFVSASAADGSDRITLPRPLTFRHMDEIAYAMRAATPQDFVATEQDSSLKVLVVDDSATARELLYARLEEAADCSRFPLQIDFADCGEDALKMAATKPYDLVMLDVELPGIDGIEVCRQIRQQRPTRVALVSGRISVNDYARGRAAGCDHYLAKPAPAEMVRTVVRLTALKKAMPVH